MKTTIGRYFIGVALVVSLRAELLPSPANDAGAGSSLAAGNWFGLAVQDSGFLLTSTVGAANQSSASSDDQGFASYYAARNENQNAAPANNTQLSSAGIFTNVAGGGAMSSSATLMAITSVNDIVTETIGISSSFASSRPVVAMSPSSSSPLPQSAYSNAWQLAPQASSSSQLSSAAPDSAYAAQLVYGGGGSTQTYSSQQSYSYLNQFTSSYAWNAPATSTSLNQSSTGGLSTSTESVDFALMNAGLSVQPTFFIPVNANLSSGQTLTSPALIPLPVNQFGSEVPEPGTWALFVSALAAVAARRRYSKS